MEYKKIGANIRKTRKKQGHSAKWLAEQLNCSEQAVSQWERGLRKMDISLIMRISEVLGCNFLDIETQLKPLAPEGNAYTHQKIHTGTTFAPYNPEENAPLRMKILIQPNILRVKLSLNSSLHFARVQFFFERQPHFQKRTSKPP